MMSMGVAKIEFSEIATLLLKHQKEVLLAVPFFQVLKYLDGYITVLNVRYYSFVRTTFKSKLFVNAPEHSDKIEKTSAWAYGNHKRRLL